MSSAVKAETPPAVPAPTSEEPVAVAATETTSPEPPEPAVLIEGHTDEEFYVTLSDAEKAQLYDRIFEHKDAIAEAEKTLKSKTKALKGQIDALTGQIEDIENMLRAGRDLRTVRCVIMLVAEPKEEKRYVRVATGEVVRVEPLTERERAKLRQKSLPLGGSVRDAGPTLVKTDKPADGAVATEASAEIPAPAGPASRRARAGALAAIPGDGGEVVRKLDARGFLDPPADRVAAMVEMLGGLPAGGLRDTLVASMGALDTLERGFAAWLEANPAAAEGALDFADDGQRETGVTEVDEFTRDIRAERANLDAIDALGQAVAVEAEHEPLPEGVVSVTLERGESDLPFHVIVVTDDALREALGRLAVSLGGSYEPAEAPEGTIPPVEIPVAPLAFARVLAIPEAGVAPLAVGELLASDAVLDELASFIAAGYGTVTELREMIAEAQPEYEAAVAALGADLAPVELLARGAWLAATARAITLKASGTPFGPGVCRVCFRQGGDAETEDFASSWESEGLCTDCFAYLEPDQIAAFAARRVEISEIDPDELPEHKAMMAERRKLELENALDGDIVTAKDANAAARAAAAAPAEPAPAAPAEPPPSRELRGATSILHDEGERVAAVLAAHEAGVLDPAPDDLARAAAKLDVDRGLELLRSEAVDDCDLCEADLIRALKTSAPGRMALSRGSYPTGTAAVDREVESVRRARAVLDIVVGWETTGLPVGPGGASVAPEKPKRKRPSRAKK